MLGHPDRVREVPFLQFEWLSVSQNLKNFQLFGVEPRYNWQNLFAISRFRYIEVLFHIFYCYEGKENRPFYREDFVI